MHCDLQDVFTKHEANFVEAVDALHSGSLQRTICMTSTPDGKHHKLCKTAAAPVQILDGRWAPFSRVRPIPMGLPVSIASRWYSSSFGGPEHGLPQSTAAGTFALETGPLRKAYVGPI